VIGLRRRNKEVLDPKYLEIGYREIPIMSPRVRRRFLRYILKSSSERKEGTLGGNI